MGKKEKFVNFVKAENILFIIVVTLFAFALRLRFFDFASYDYEYFLHGWFSAIREHGGLAAVGLDLGDYTPLYYYLLALVSYIPVNDLYLIKALSCAGDVVLAAFVMRIVKLRYSEFWGEISYAVVMFLPSVVINSSVWAQCDSIYTAALTACVYYLMADKDYSAVVAFSIAFSLKLQAVFLAPLMLLLVLKRRIKARAVLILPLVYFVSVLPAAFMGRNIWDLMTIYVSQAGEYKDINMNIPNLFTWFPQDAPAYAGRTAVYFAGAFVLVTLAYLCSKRFTLSKEMVLALALFYAMLLPYILPYMHERYYYPADILSVVFAFYFPDKVYVPVITVFTSTYSVCRFLFGTHFINMKILSLLMLFNLIWVGIHIIYRIRGEEKKDMVYRY
ncbi:MAG TPA: hypothetical protein DIV41_00315 [Ruminococcaceae bacterium]|jgi:Gpi18-like mannosyltransferase|nr:hypothetical protein [Oscillospiraceae bacterium]